MKKDAKFSQKLLSCVRKKRFSITVSTIIIAAFLIIAVPLIVNGCSFSLEFLQISALTAQIISAIFVIAGVVVGVWQYYIASRSYATNLAKERIEKAIKLSEYYKDNVLPLYTAINFIFQRSGVSSLLEKAKSENMKNFNANEIKNVIDEKTHDEIKKMNNSEKFAESILLADRIYGLNLRLLSVKRKTTVASEVEEKRSEKQRQLVAVTFASDVVSKILNNLEYFAFNFTHNVADESVIYQSIAPTYIKLVECLYFSIAEVNVTNSANTYYTNVTELYLTWKNKQVAQQRHIDTRLNTNVIDKGSVLQEG